ncbi:mucin-19-like [Lacerta agilis]|uniref:mucin-19-like n=1 Tax=Lacerta agilis TaxID=80427 RepID=UPI00141A1CE5|nr:mucin-19-like [Lacerta agilis]
MDPVETGGIANIWVGSNQKSITVDGQQTNSVDIHSVTNTTTTPRNTPTLQNTAPIDEDIVTSEATFAIISKSITTSQPSPNTIHQNHIGPALENDTATVSCEGRDTSGESHISISKAARSKSSSRDAPRVVSQCGSSFKSKDAPGNANSTASEDALSKGCVIEVSCAVNKASATEETSTVLGNISTTGDNFYKAPRNTAMDESNRDTAVAVTPGISCAPAIALGDICNRKSVPAPGDSNSITSREKATDSSFFREATVFGATMDTNGAQVTSGPEDYTTKVCDITSFCDELTSGTNPVSDPGEISATTFKETSFSSPDNAAVFSGGCTANPFSAENSVVTTAFSACSQPPSAVVSTNASLALDGNNTTAGPGDSPTNGKKTGSVSREANVSSSTATTSRDTHKASTDGSFNTSGNISTPVPLEVVTTDSGNSVTIPSENDTSLGSITTTCLDTATINEPFFILPGNVTNVVGIIDTTTGMFKNMATIHGNIPATIVVETITIANPSEEIVTMPSSGNVRETPIPRETASTESENSTATPSSIHVCEIANATGYIDSRDCGDNTIREDSVATTPENANQTEFLTSSSKGANISSRENLGISLKKTCGDTTAIAPFVENTPIPVGTKTTETPGNTLSNMVGNMVAMNPGSTVVSGDAVSTTSDKDTTFRHKDSSDCLGDNATPGNDHATMCTEENCFLHDDAITTVSSETFVASQDATLNVPGSVTITTFSQDTTECSAETELGKPSETIADKTTIASGNITTPCEKTASTGVIIPTNISRSEPAREATTRNTTTTLDDQCAPALQSTGVATPEEVTVPRTSIASREAATIHLENASATVTTSTASEDASITSADAAPSIGKNIIDVVSGDASTLTHSAAQDRNLNASTIAGDSKAPSDATMAVPGVATPNPGSATNNSLLSTEIEEDAAEDTTTKDTPGSLLMNATKSRYTSTDTSEEMCYGDRVDSVNSETTTIRGHMPTPSLSFSAGTSIQEANTSPGDSTPAFGCTTKIPEGAHVVGTVNSVHDEMLLALEQASCRKTTSSGHVIAEATAQSERNLTENAAGSSGDNKIWIDTPTVVGTKKGTPGSSATSRTFKVSEVTTTFEDARYTAATSVSSVFATGDNNTIATSVGTNFIPTTKFKEPTATNVSGDVSQTTILGKDTITITTTTMGATSTVTSPRDTVMATQAFPEDITTVSRNRSTNILQDTPKLGEIVTSEDTAAATTSLRDIRIHCDVLSWGTRSSADTHILEETSDLAIPKDDLSSDLSIITTNVTTSTSNTLSDTVSTPDNATSEFKITTSSDGIPTSRDVPATIVGVRIQDQTSITAAPTVVPEICSFATGENVTTIAQTVTGDATIATVPQGTVTGNVTIINNPENVANITVSPRGTDDDASNPWDRTTLTLEKGKTPSLGNAINVTTPLREASAHPHSFPPTEAFSTPDSTLYGDTTGRPGAVFIPSLDTISIPGDTSKIPETCIAFDNSITPTQLVDGTDLPVATEDKSSPRATPSITTSEDLSIITVAPEATTVPGWANANEYRGAIATPVPEHITTTSDVIVLSSGDGTTGLSGSQDIITTATPSEDIIASITGGNISFSESIATSEEPVTSRQISMAAILEDTEIQKDTSGATTSCLEETPVTEVHSVSEMTLTCREDTSITPETTLTEDSILFPLAAAITLSSGTILSHSETTSLGQPTDLSLSTISSADSIARTFTNPREDAHIFSRGISVPFSGGTGKETSTIETTLGIAEAHTSKATPPPEESLVPGDTSASEDTSTRAATFDTGKSSTSDANSVLEIHSSSEAAAATTPISSASFPGIIDSTPCDSDRPDETLTSGKVTTIEVHGKVPSSRATTSPREALVFQDNATSASGCPNTPENIRNAPENPIDTVLEVSILVSGSNNTALDDLVTTTPDKSNDTHTRESATIEGAQVISYRKRPTRKLREADTSTPTGITMVLGGSSTIPPAEATTVTSGKSMGNSSESPMSTEQNSATVSRDPSAAPELVLNANIGKTNIAITGKTTDSTTRSMDPGVSLAISPGEVPDAATFGENVDTTAETHGHDLAPLEVSLIDTPREVAKPGNATEATQREIPTAICETTTVIHRKISPAVPRKTPTTATSEAFPSTALGEIAPTISEGDAMDSKGSPSAAPTENTPIAAPTCKTAPVVAPRGVTSASQGKSSVVKPAVALPPYWSTLLIGMLVILVLAVGFCMVIYYATFFILASYSTL